MVAHGGRGHSSGTSEYKRYFQLTTALLFLVLMGGVVVVGKLSEYANEHNRLLRTIKSKLSPTFRTCAVQTASPLSARCSCWCDGMQVINQIDSLTHA